MKNTGLLNRYVRHEVRTPRTLTLLGSASMSIYRTCHSSKYRRIYEKHYGPIPKDSEGKSYDIHHLDGNHKNNDPSNLVALTIQEHYDIHHKQHDWGACHRMAIRMKFSPDEISDLAKKAVIKQIEDGKNILVGPENNRRMLEEGTHPLLGGEASRKGIQSQLKSGIHASQRVAECEVCGKIIKGSANYQRHLNYCKNKRKK